MRRPTQLRHLAPRVRPGMTVTYDNLRRACVAAAVPLQDREGWALADEQVVAAVEAAREGAGLRYGAAALEYEVSAGRIALGSRVVMGRAVWSEVLTLASVLRSPVADEVTS